MYGQSINILVNSLALYHESWKLGDTLYCYWKEFVDSAARRSKASKKARFGERKICICSDASSCGCVGGGHLSKGWFPILNLNKQGVRAFTELHQGGGWGGGGVQAETA